MPRSLFVLALSLLVLLPTAAEAEAPATPSPFSFVKDAYRAGEGAGPATITLTRADATAAQSVVVATDSSGTATPGDDFTAIAQTVVFPAGETLRTVEVPVLDDAVDEVDETIGLTLGDPSVDSAVLTVADDDPTTQTVTQTTTTTTPAPTPPPEPARPTIRIIPDTTPPVALVVAKNVKNRTLRSNGVTLLYSCNEACKVAATLKIGTRTIASGSSELRAPGIKRFRVSLNAAGLRAVRVGRSYRVRVVARVADFRRNAATSTSAFTVVR